MFLPQQHTMHIHSNQAMHRVKVIAHCIETIILHYPRHCHGSSQWLTSLILSLALEPVII